ncbi:hypothetical protein F0562_025203 [Nyssa sinensis]|uniref:Thiamine pyrophosphate enzyme TPP-binding domain-containing protein n=1 Tax=Nyssa sinensis TaxID=561372 RepID=A0A5J5BFY3_9ASTE|nr:hypothetical protein F0562_025203 [Nyssa sinensis]
MQSRYNIDDFVQEAQTQWLTSGGLGAMGSKLPAAIGAAIARLDELIKKFPLVLWKEKVQSLIGYRERKKKIETCDDLLDMEDEDLFGSVSDDNNVHVEPEQEENISNLEDDSITGNSEMERFVVHTRILKHHEDMQGGGPACDKFVEQLLKTHEIGGCALYFLEVHMKHNAPKLTDAVECLAKLSCENLDFLYKAFSRGKSL